MKIISRNLRAVPADELVRPHLIFKVDIGAVLQELLHDLGVPLQRGSVQSGPLHLGVILICDVSKTNKQTKMKKNGNTSYEGLLYVYNLRQRL